MGLNQAFTATNQTDDTDSRVRRLLNRIKIVLATVTGYTGGSGIQVKFAEDTAAAGTSYNVLLPYNAQKPVVGDKVLVARIDSGGNGPTSVVLGAYGAPPAATSQAVPSGMIAGYAVSSAPAGWLLCDGSAVSRTTYADLFNAIGTTFGAGDGSTTFNVPDYRGRMLLGAGSGSGLTTRSLGQTGGGETHIISGGELPGHTHTISALPSGNITAGVLGGGTNVAAVTAPGNTGSTGSGSPMTLMNPWAVASYIIKL